MMMHASPGSLSRSADSTDSESEEAAMAVDSDDAGAPPGSPIKRPIDAAERERESSADGGPGAPAEGEGASGADGGPGAPAAKASKKKKKKQRGAGGGKGKGGGCEGDSG